MGLKELFKRTNNKETNSSQDIDIEIYSKYWEETAKGLRGENKAGIDSMLFKKLGFTIGDEIKIYSVEVPEQISERVNQWREGYTNLPKRFFKIVSAQRGEFILGACHTSANLIKKDLTEEKQYEFTFSELDQAKLTSVKNIIYNSNIILTISYSYNQVLILCKNFKKNEQSINLKFSVAHKSNACFDDPEVTEANINQIKEETAEIRKQLLELKEIPNNENDNGVIKLFNEISLNEFFTPKIALDEINITDGNREDIVKFKDKKVESYQINDLTKETKKHSSNEYIFVSKPNFEIKVPKEILLNADKDKKCLLNDILTGINEQENLFAKVEEATTKSLKLGKSSK